VCAVPNMAVLCSSLILCYPVMSLGYFLNDFQMVPFVPIISGITFAITYTCAVIFLDTLFITLLTPEIASSVKIHVSLSLSLLLLYLVVTKTLYWYFAFTEHLSLKYSIKTSCLGITHRRVADVMIIKCHMFILMVVIHSTCLCTAYVLCTWHTVEHYFTSLTLTAVYDSAVRIQSWYNIHKHVQNIWGGAVLDGQWASRKKGLLWQCEWNLYTVLHCLVLTASFLVFFF
jgi:hypothetical protein